MPHTLKSTTFGDKTSAKELAIKGSLHHIVVIHHSDIFSVELLFIESAFRQIHHRLPNVIPANVPIITGSDSAFSTPGEAEAWINDPNNPITYPVIVKAAMGGGGRGIRIVPTASDLDVMFRLASNEALNAFGDGRCFVEKYVDRPRHIEVQCLGDGNGNVVHLYDRDCSVQRRHQKVIETAPVTGLPRETRESIFRDACRLLAMNKYRNAGTVEFLVDKNGQHYFMEVNPRVQVEHVSKKDPPSCMWLLSHSRH